VVIVVVGAKRGVRRRVVFTEVAHALGGGCNGADMSVPAASKADDFATDGVFLVGEFECDKVGSIQAIDGYGGCTVSLGAYKELDVL
jgi:hypothetical protein